MIKFLNDHIIIFINIDDTMSILIKKNLNIKGYTYKISHISAAYSPLVANMVPTYCYDTALYLNGNMFQLSHLHIHGN